MSRSEPRATGKNGGSSEVASSPHVVDMVSEGLAQVSFGTTRCTPRLVHALRYSVSDATKRAREAPRRAR
jgi:hypothetical protein